MDIAKSTTTRILIKFVILTFVSLVVWLATAEADQPGPSMRTLQSYLTSPTRMRIVETFCTGASRASSATEEDRNLNDQYVAILNSSFQIDGNNFINELANDWSQAVPKVRQHQTGFLLFAGPFAIALILLLLLIPFLSCCCCCPNRCPPACCRLPKDQLYSKCELRWPAIVAILSLLLAIAAASYGFNKASMAQSTLQTVGCSLAIVPDDLLNGNVTSDKQHYFIGLNMLAQSLNWFSGNLTTINNAAAKFNTSNSNMTTAVSDGYLLMNNTKDVDGNTGSGMTSITYGPPISQISTFPTVLGTYATTGLIYTFYSVVKGIVDSLVSVGSNVEAYLLVAPSMSSSIGSAQSSIYDFINQISTIDTEVDKYPGLQSGAEKSSFYIKIFYGAVLGLGVVAILGAFLMCCCQKVKCRYLMYFSCFFLSTIAIIGLLIATTLSVTLPFYHWGCQFMNTALSNTHDFSSTFSFIQGNFRFLDYQTQLYLKTCMPFGNGNIIAQFNTNLDSLNGLTQTFSFLNSVDFAYLAAGLSLAKNEFVSNVEVYGSSQRADVSSTAIGILQTYANAANFVSCTDSNFGLDSYVPSISQNPEYVSCTVSGNSAGSSACSGNFNPKGGSCYGCLDIASIFASYPNGALVTSDLNARYANNPGCNSFAAGLGNLWTNFYNPKQINIGNSQHNTGIYSAVSSLNIASFQADLITLGGALAGVKPTINSLNSLLDTEYGMLGGLNCSLFGEDFQNIVNNSCVLGFNTLFNIRLSLGICSFGLFFASLCSVCAGSRYARQEDKTKGKVANSGVDQKEGKVQPTNSYVLEETLESLGRGIQ